MNKGAYWAGSPLHSDQDRNPVQAPVLEAVAPPPPRIDSDEVAEPVKATTSERLVIVLAVLAALGWLAVVAGLAIAAFGAGPIGLGDVARGISLASGPLALLVAVLILWQRNASREAARYADVARGVRMETLALDAVLSLTSKRLAEDRTAVAEQADRLLSLADQTSAKLTSVADQLSREIAELGQQSRDLDAAAGTARVDMGVLLADLPTAEQQVRTLAETLRTAGVAAHEQSAGLQAILAALALRAKEAEDNAAGAANRLSAQVSHIAGATEIATRDIDAAGGRMSSAIDAVMARTADAMERTREGVAAQGSALSGMIEQAQSEAEAAASRAAATLESRIAAIGQEVAALASTLESQDAVGVGMIERIQRGLSAVEARFAELDETGGARTQRLGDALGTLLQHTERTMGMLNDGGTAATTLINRTETLRAAIDGCLTELGEALPAALDRLEAEAARSRDTVGATTPEVERLVAVASEAAASLETGRTELATRAEAIDALAALITARLGETRTEAAALDETIGHADARAEKLADSTTPKLVEALIRVRETAGQAAERAREALGAIVPHSASALGEASRKALESAVGTSVQEQIERVSSASDAAVEAARAATLRLEEQLARVSETSASVEDHIAAGKAEVEGQDRDNFSRRVSLLIDSLNSTSIDVTKLLSNEATDSAWTAYLRGDRGVFTRRAVKLLESGEVREITRHYESEPEFREQVNRYIHDFEALLRPILATRDGSALGVILLSSEMGKLYVALAQAIERLRA
jgi:hypothetical protein